MLLEFHFNNFRSYQGTAEFDMNAPASKVKKRFPNNYVHQDPGYDVLKTAVIVGENAGGKSNFVRAVQYFQSLLVGNNNVRAYRSEINTNNISHKGENENTEQSFIMKTLIESKVYYFELVIDHLGIVKEKLSVSGRKKAIGNDSFKEIYHVKRIKEKLLKPGTSDPNTQKGVVLMYEAAISEDSEKTLMDRLKESMQDDPQKLFLNRLDLLGYKSASIFMNWVRCCLCPETSAFDYDLVKSIQKNEEDLEILYKPEYFNIFRLIDYSIVGLQIENDDPFRKSLIIRKGKNGEEYKRELQYDSSGVRGFFAWAIQIYKVVFMDKTVIADEMDRFLNPVMSDRVIAYINGMDHKGQFIFTTHNVLHLDLKIYMKEQIYFVSKNIESLESELYSLADFPDVRYETAKVYEIYMKGVLGGAGSEQA